MKRLLLLLFVIFLATAPAYAQKSFDMRYNEAVEYYTQKQYDKAIKVLDAAKKSPGVTKEQIAKANRLKNQCIAAKQKMGDLNLSKEVLVIPGSGQLDSIYVTAGKPWSVTANPSWCVTRQEADVLFIEVMPNQDLAPRKGIIEVSMGKERTAYLVIEQAERLEISCPVRVLTKPERAMITIDNNQGMLSEDFVLNEGKHRIRVEKNGYERRDTTICIGPEHVDGAVLEFALKPLFATVSVDINPVDGYSFDSNPTLDIGGNKVDLYPSIIKRFNIDQDISYYSLYDGNLIPLHPGQYVLTASADGFVSERKVVELLASDNERIEFKLAPVCGTISVKDEENAAGAVVFIDGKEAGSIPLDGVVLKKGIHTLRIEKPGFRTEQASYEIEVFGDKNTEFKAAMQRFGEYSITSEPAYCRISLDDTYVGTTPLTLMMSEGSHQLKIEKAGYYPIIKNVITEADGQVHEMNVTLENAYPVMISCDKDSLDVIISKGSGGNRTVYAEGVRTPASVQLPLSTVPYNIEVLRGDKTAAYRGKFKFDSESKNTVKVLTWTDGTPYVYADYLIGTKPFELGGKSFGRIANIGISSMRLLPGLSSNIAKVGLFAAKDKNQITFPADDSGNVEFKSDEPIAVMPAISLLLINEEFRVGGALLPFLDVAGLVEYAWYPNYNGILKFSHISGHEVFVGAEFTSRLQIFNVNIKTGLLGFFGGKANLCRPESAIVKTLDEAAGIEVSSNRYWQADYNPGPQFVISLGFTLGGPNSRGENMLRVF